MVQPKPRYRKKRYYIPAGVVAFLLIVGGCGGSSSKKAVEVSPSSSCESWGSCQGYMPSPSVSATPTPTYTPLPTPSVSLSPTPVNPAPVGSSADLPNRTLTPGSWFVSATTAQICVSGYSASVRDVSESTRHSVFTAYGIAYPPPTGKYELDHLVALELGGDNTAANLWPEVYDGTEGAHTKDELENHLHDLVCSGQVPLLTAQQTIANDWEAAAAKYGTTSVTASAPKATSVAPAPKTTSAPAGAVVHAGSFCAPAGATGVTSAGTSMVCGPAKDGRNRWHAG